MLRDQLLRLLDDKLEPWRYHDYAPNGLQVEGRSEIRKIIAGVTASQALIDAAIVEKRHVCSECFNNDFFWSH